VAALVSAIALATRAPAGTIEPGRQLELTRLVRAECGSCHGLTLKGGLGKPLDAEALADMDAAGIAAIILSGVPGTPMPPWRGLLTRDEAEWIADALKSGFPEAR